MTPRQIPDQITRVSTQELSEALSDAWRDLFGDPPARASVLVLLAHWTLETGAGRSMHCFNLGNIKHTPSDGHSWCTFRHNEVLSGKIVWLDETDPFRAYDTLGEGATDYLATIHRRFASSWPAVIAGDPAAFAHLLKMQRYYTADEGAYTRGLVRIYHQLTDALVHVDVPDALEKLGYAPDGVEAFQRDHKLDADGIVGPLTRSVLVHALEGQA